MTRVAMLKHSIANNTTLNTVIYAIGFVKQGLNPKNQQEYLDWDKTNFGTV